MIGKQVLAFGKSEKSECINIRIFVASSGGRKGRHHIGRFTPDRERSHVCLAAPIPCVLYSIHQILLKSEHFGHPKMSHLTTKPTKGSPSLIRVFVVRMKNPWVLSCPLSAQRRLGSDLADAQADLSLPWAHMPFC